MLDILNTIDLYTMGAAVIISFVLSIILGLLFKRSSSKKIKRQKEEMNEIILMNDFENRKNLQIQSFYQEMTGKKVNKVFEEWLNIIEKTNEQAEVERDNDNVLNKLLANSIQYGSDKTIKITTLFQQVRHKNEDNINYRVVIVMYCALICSLKKDFTGHDITIEDILKIKLPDYYEHEKEYADLIKENGLIEFSDLKGKPNQPTVDSTDGY